MSFLSDVLAAVGGTSHVPYVRIANIGQTVSGGKLQTWDDARGSGLTATASGSPKPAVDAVTGVVTCDGTQNYYATPSDAMFDLSQTMTFVYVGSVPSGYAVNLQDNPLSYWESLYGQPAGIKSLLLSDPKSSRGATGSSQQIIIRSFPGGSGGVLTGDQSAWIEAVGHIPLGIDDLPTRPTSGNRLLAVGSILSAGQFAATAESFTMLVDHQLSSTEHNTLVALLVAQFAPTVDLSHGAIMFDGDSRTAGVGAATTPFPDAVMATLALGSAYEWSNFGLGSRQAAVQLAQFDKRVAPLYRAGKTGKQIYVLWGSFINDVTAGYTGAQAQTHIVDNCSAAKAAGLDVVVATEIPWTTDPHSTERLAFNSYMRANYLSFADALADIAQIINLQDPTNTTYFADQIHCTDAGYALVANDATYGVAAAITRILSAPNIPAGANAMHYYRQLVARTH